MNKSVLLVATTMLFAGASFAQKNKNVEVTFPELPMNDEGKFEYSGVPQVDGVSAGDLYARFLTWFNGEFKNPSEKLRKQDKEAKEIEVFLRHRIYNKDKNGNQASDAGLVQFSLFVYFKDGRYKYVFNNFHHKQRSYFALEQWLDKDDEMAAKHADYLAQTDIEVKRVIAAMKAGLADDGKKEEEDW